MQELLNLFFDNNFVDATSRHVMTNNGVVLAQSNISPACASFDGNSYLITDNNLSDFLLGATPYPHAWKPTLASVFKDNNFTLDCWIYPKLGGRRYYPICSSFSSTYWNSSYKTGWVVQLDTATGHLQTIGYFGNNYDNNVWEYSFQIPFNQWTHITIMSWRVLNQSSLTAKMIFINGHPVKTSIEYFPNMFFTNGISDPSGSTSAYQYGSFYVGLGPSSQLTDPGQPWASDLVSNYFFCGLIDSLRICIGPRFLNTDISGNLLSFSPPGSESTSTTVSTTASTTSSTVPGVLTFTTSTTPIPTTSTTYIPRNGYIDSLIALSFNQTTEDVTNRHFSTTTFGYYSYNPETRRAAAYFDGHTDVEYSYNLSDWNLYSTSCGLYCSKDQSWNYFCNWPDNYFTIDCLVSVILGSTQFYPICSSFNSIGTGWTLQVDTNTMRLQFIGFSLGSHRIDLTLNSNSRNQNGEAYNTPSINILMESTFTIPLNTLVHIAVTSYRNENQKSVKFMYLNGVPDRSVGWLCPGGVWSSQGQVIANNPAIESGSLKIGSSPELDLVSSYIINTENINYFKGFISNLEISRGNKFPVDGTSFSPPTELRYITLLSSSSITSTITTTSSTNSSTLTTTSTTVSTTSLFVPLIKDIIMCPFLNNTGDVTNRHNLNLVGKNYSMNNSFYLDGDSYFFIEDNLPDFMLGSSPYQMSNSFPNYVSNNLDNNFTLDCWVQLELGGNRYYPICSSFLDRYYDEVASIGWFFQIDTNTGKLQVGGYNKPSQIYSSNFTINIDSTVWNHIAIMMWVTSYQGVKYNLIVAYLNGVPDVFICPIAKGPSLSNVFFGPDGTLISKYAPMYIGALPKSIITDPTLSDKDYFNRDYLYKFKGNIRGFRICQGLRYPVATLSNGALAKLSKFSPPLLYGPAPTETTQSTSTITTTISYSSTSSITPIVGTTVTYSSTTTWTSTTALYTTTTQIPMYTNVSSSAIVSASNFLAPYIPQNVQDFNINTFWLCSSYSGPPYWLMYHWTDRYCVVDEYKVFFSSGGTPKRWQFHGSYDGTNWNVLDEQHDTSQRTGLVSISFNNLAGYSYYRLYILDVWSTAHGIRINEFQLYSNYRVNKVESRLPWVGRDFKTSTLVQRYCINVSDGSTFSEWKLQGSNDNYFWIDVDHQISAEWIGWKCVDISSNQLSFSKWRILITNWNASSNPGICEIQFFQRP